MGGRSGACMWRIMYVIVRQGVAAAAAAAAWHHKMVGARSMEQLSIRARAVLFEILLHSRATLQPTHRRQFILCRRPVALEPPSSRHWQF